MHFLALWNQFDGSQEDKVGVYSINRFEWILTLLATVQQSMILVPLYDTLGMLIVLLHLIFVLAPF